MVDLYKKCLEVIFNHVFEFLIVEMWIKMLFIFTFVQNQKILNKKYQVIQKSWILVLHHSQISYMSCTLTPYGWFVQKTSRSNFQPRFRIPGSWNVG